MIVRVLDSNTVSLPARGKGVLASEREGVVEVKITAGSGGL